MPPCWGAHQGGPGTPGCIPPPRPACHQHAASESISREHPRHTIRLQGPCSSLWCHQSDPCPPPSSTATCTRPAHRWQLCLPRTSCTFAFPRSAFRLMPSSATASVVMRGPLAPTSSRVASALAVERQEPVAAAAEAGISKHDMSLIYMLMAASMGSMKRLLAVARACSLWVRVQTQWRSGSDGHRPKMQASVDSAWRCPAAWHTLYTASSLAGSDYPPRKRVDIL
jgi:hypothetical protein